MSKSAKGPKRCSKVYKIYKKLRKKVVQKCIKGGNFIVLAAHCTMNTATCSLYTALDQAKISSEKFTYATFRPELCPKLLLGIIIMKMPRKTFFFFSHQSLSAPIITMGITMEKRANMWNSCF